MDRPSRIALILASFYAVSGALAMTVWWAARLDYLAPVGTRGTLAAFAPALPWYLLGAEVGNIGGHGLGIAMTVWGIGLAINGWLVFVASRYLGRRIRISWARAV